MPTTALFIIDPPERLDPPTDTSLAIMRESLARGWRVAYTTPDRLEGSAEGLWATVREVAFVPGRELFVAAPPFRMDLATCDVVWFRKDPPVDLAYLHATYLLDALPAAVLQVNPAAALRDYCEKLIPARFPEHFPPTLTTASAEALAAFARRHGKIVVKPLEDCSGHGIVALEAGDPELATALRRATAGDRRTVQGQAFLEAIADGDIRVLLLGGEVLGWVRRRTAPGDFRSTVNAGGRCEPCTLSAGDRALCEQIGAWLRRESIHLAGVDLVAGKILEVNITSPSCLREINALCGVRLEERIVDYVAERVRQRAGKG